LPSSKPRRRFEDIIQNVDAARRYTSGMTANQFIADDKTVDAVERCLSRISEAASKLAGDAEALVPGEEWGKIRGLGNLLRHEYDVIERPVLWDIIEHNLVPLRRACVRAIELIDQGLDRDPGEQAPE
jgi:uncharacterized protein with HEPN domain